MTSNLASILQWLYPLTSPGVPWALQDDGDGPYISSWSVPGVPQPTVQDVLDQEADWLAAGGALADLRRRAKEALSDQADATRALIRAVVLETLGLVNGNAEKHNDLLAWLGTQTSLTQRTLLPGFVQPTPTAQQARDAIIARIAAGEADS